jgi:hypothetical protein
MVYAMTSHNKRGCPGAAIKLHKDKIKELVAQLLTKVFPPGVAEQEPGLAPQPWGSLDMLLVDPFGNRLIFTNASAPVLRGSSPYSE